MEWISVKDRLSENMEDILIIYVDDWNYNSKIHYSVSYLNSEGKFYSEKHCCYVDVTHWMPLPKPPEETSG